LTTDKNTPVKSSKLIDALEWIFGLNSSKKGEKNYSSWVITVLVILICSLLAIYNQIYHLQHVSLESWKIFTTSVTNYHHVMSQIEAQPLETNTIHFTKMIAPLNTSQLPNDTYFVEDLHKNATQITEYFEQFPPSNVTMKRLSVRFEKSRNRLVLNYSQFFEHTSVYNAYISKFPHRFYQNYLHISPTSLYTLNQHFDVKLISTRGE
jgi:hypothetical protein